MGNIRQYVNFASGETVPFYIEQDGQYLDQDVDIDFLRFQIDNNIVSSSFRILVLYPDETINYAIPSENIKAGGNYSENYQNGQRRSLSFTLYNNDGAYSPNINTLWAGTRLRLEMGVHLFSGATIWFYKGVYVIDKVTPSLTTSGKEVQVSAKDKFSLFEDATGRIEETTEIPVGSDIESVIKDCLLTSMGSGNPLDVIPIIYHSSFKDKKTQATISKSAGDTIGSLLLELATQLSAEIFYNAMGNLVVVPIANVTSDADKPLLYEYSTKEGTISQLDFSFDYNSIVNRIIVTGSSASGGISKAVAINDDPGSPLCYQRIGYRTGNIINDSNITSDFLAQERADYELRQQLIIKSSTSASVLYNPLLEVNNLIAVSDDFFNLVHERFLIQNVSCSLDYTGQMNINFTNLVNLPFVTNIKEV